MVKSQKRSRRKSTRRKTFRKLRTKNILVGGNINKTIRVEINKFANNRDAGKIKALFKKLFILMITGNKDNEKMKLSELTELTEKLYYNLLYPLIFSDNDELVKTIELMENTTSNFLTNKQDPNRMQVFKTLTGDLGYTFLVQANRLLNHSSLALLKHKP